MPNRQVLLTKKVTIRCSHQLSECFSGQKATPKELSLHGHHYEVFVTLKGAIDTNSGLIVHRDQFDKILQERVIQKYDKTLLNRFFDKPTGEILVQSLTEELLESDLNKHLHQVQIKETDKNFFSGPICND